MRIHRLRAALLALLLVPLLATTAATADTAKTADTAAAEWQNGKHDEDTIYDCRLESLRTGLSADASWLATDGRVPEVGEVFYVRGFAGLVGLPCSGKVAVVPEVLLPAGVEYADDEDHPVRWALTAPGETQQLSTEQLAYFLGVNGGVVLEVPGGGSWTLRQGYVMEIQIPVRATRELKGPATQQPECQDRRDGDAPCPVSQAGDHLQLAFTVGGHGGDKSYVTPYVALFASKRGTTPPPVDPVPTTRAASSTTATFKVGRKAKGRAVVTVRSKVAPAGRVVVTDRGRPIGAGTVRAGRADVTLPRLRKGKHVLVVRYAGSPTVKPSQSSARTVVVR